jgi:hypothetical protein
MTPGGDKNGADINLALDALEMAFTHAHINAFVIVGGDSDFITLVEKLKQYDRKVFVVGGRAFTSQVMQKNCTEFIAYENVVSDLSTHSGPRPESRGARGGRQQKHGKVDRPRSNGSQNIENAVPLVKRALTVLSDREVSPQLDCSRARCCNWTRRSQSGTTVRERSASLPTNLPRRDWCR